jgi:hypothetical protein
MHKKTETIETKMAKNDPATFELDLNYLGEIGSSSSFFGRGLLLAAEILELS